jgi:hypothetical protein
MRFNNRFCALMDIPDLPSGAFEHIGNKKIKPQGGGGGIVSAITDPISSAIGTDGGGGGILGALADIDPGPAIGSGLADVDKFVGREIPGGWKTVGAAAAILAAPYAAPYFGAGAAGSTAGGFVAADAAGLAASGLSEAAIAQNLAMAGAFTVIPELFNLFKNKANHNSNAALDHSALTAELLECPVCGEAHGVDLHLAEISEGVSVAGANNASDQDHLHSLVHHGGIH